jgi:hypothetical protein
VEVCQCPWTYRTIVTQFVPQPSGYGKAERPRTLRSQILSGIRTRIFWLSRPALSLLSYEELPIMVSTMTNLSELSEQRSRKVVEKVTLRRMALDGAVSHVDGLNPRSGTFYQTN